MLQLLVVGHSVRELVMYKNWNGSRLNELDTGNTSNDWKAMIMDQVLGRIDDVTTGCRDWDMSGYLSQQWVGHSSFCNEGMVQ